MPVLPRAGPCMIHTRYDRLSSTGDAPRGSDAMCVRAPGGGVMGGLMRPPEGRVNIVTL